MQQTKKKNQTPRYKNQKRKRAFMFVGFCILIFGFFISPSTLKAEPTQQGLSLYLSNRITANGYTITFPDNQLRIKISPHSINRAVVAEVAEAKTYPPIPADKDLVSKVYSYALLPSTDNALRAPILFEMQYPEDEERWREIHLYNEHTNQWDHQKGWISIEGKYVISETMQASGLLAVFADHLDKSSYVKEKITAPSIYVVDAQTGEVLIERGSTIQRPIASLTKLATATVFTENNPGWDTPVFMQKEDDTIPAKIYTHIGDAVSAQDLFYATLMRSANNAAKALARSTGMNTHTFAQAMNTSAHALGMEHSNFVEPTGLSEHNISTAQDMYMLAQHAFADPVFLQATTPKNRTITVENKPYALKNTNRILDVPYTVLGSKTGYTHEAGRCLVMKARNKAGREVIAITLGGRVPNGHWSDMRMLLDAALGE